MLRQREPAEWPPHAQPRATPQRRESIPPLLLRVDLDQELEEVTLDRILWRRGDRVGRERPPLGPDPGRLPGAVRKGSSAKLHPHRASRGAGATYRTNRKSQQNRKMNLGTWNPGTLEPWNLGTWNLEPWNLEPGTWNPVE